MIATTVAMAALFLANEMVLVGSGGGGRNGIGGKVGSGGGGRVGSSSGTVAAFLGSSVMKSTPSLALLLVVD